MRMRRRNQEVPVPVGILTIWVKKAVVEALAVRISGGDWKHVIFNHNH